MTHDEMRDAVRASVQGTPEVYPVRSKHEENNVSSIRSRLEYLRGEIRAERISWGELLELQGLAEHIDPGDMELREVAGIPEDDES